MVGRVRIGRAVGSSPRGGALLLALLMVGIIVCRALVLRYDHSLNSIDGALQTWFALDHFARGEQLGSEFQSYLGVTMILAMLPLFVGLGQTLYASSVAANCAVVAGVFAAAYGVAWLVRPIRARDRWAAAILLVFVFYFALRLAAEALDYRYPLSFDPGVSLRSVRGFLPLFMLPVLVATLRAVLRGDVLRPGFALGLVAGAGLLWSNDAGIPMALALVLALALALLRHPQRLATLLASLGAGTAISAGAILLVVTQGEPGPWLQYNFRDVAGDQFWLFAPWGRETRILGPFDLINIARGAEPIPLACLILLAGAVLLAMIQLLRGRGSPVRQAALVFLGASTIGTALIPQIGGHVEAYYIHVTTFLGACAPVIVGQRALLRLMKPGLVRLGRAPLRLAGAGAAAIMLAVEGFAVAATATASDRTAFSRELGFYVTAHTARDLAAMQRIAADWDARKVPPDRRLLSVYTSPLDIAAGVRSPAAVGSLIHALGEGNRAAMTALVAEREVAAVTTIAPRYSGWEGWLVRANWPFFHALQRQYRAIGANDQHVLWVRARTRAAPLARAQCRAERIAQGAIRLRIAAARGGIASVSVSRREPFASGRNALLTVTETSPVTAAARAQPPPWNDFPRYGIANTARLELMVPVEPGEPSELRLEVLDGSAIGTADCTAELLAAPDYAVLPTLPEGIARYLAERGR